MIIKNNVSIGDKVTVLGGVTIGENSIIGANSVGTSNVEPYIVYSGVPVRLIKKII